MLGFIKKKLNIGKSEYRNYIIIMGLALILFLLIYGIRAINPFNIEWIFCNKDLYDHYLRWVAYRHSRWTFPIMGSNALTYPDYKSFITRDNVIFLELIFKIFSPILPSDFQYFGLWGLICFLLQAYFSVKLFEKLLDDDNRVLLASGIYIILPALMGRMYSCTAMTANWVVTILVYFFIGYTHNGLQAANMYRYVGIMSVAGILISPFYSVVIIAFGAGMFVWDSVNENGNSGLVLLGETVAVPYLSLLILGGYDEIRGALRVMIPRFSFYAKPDDAYRVYIGLGDILFLLYVLYDYCDKIKLKEIIKTKWKYLLSVLVILLIISSLVVLQPVIDNVIAKTPTTLGFYLTVFETAIITLYIMGIPIVYAITYSVKKKEKKELIILLLVTLLSQFDNVYYVINEKHDTERKVEPLYETIEAKSFWDALAYKKDISNISLTFSYDRNLELIRWVLDSGKICEGVSGKREVSDLTDTLMEPDEHTMYVFNGDDASIDYLQYTDLSFYKADSYVVGYSGDTSGTITVDASELCTKEYKMDDGAVLNGTSIAGKKILYPHFGRSFGRYCSIGPYNYLIRIRGDNLLGNVNIILCSEYGEKFYDYLILEKSDEEIVVGFLNDEPDENFEVIVDNISKERVIVSSYILTPFRGQQN